MFFCDGLQFDRDSLTQHPVGPRISHPKIVVQYIANQYRLVNRAYMLAYQSNIRLVIGYIIILYLVLLTRNLQQILFPL